MRMKRVILLTAIAAFLTGAFADRANATTITPQTSATVGGAGLNGPIPPQSGGTRSADLPTTVEINGNSSVVESGRAFASYGVLGVEDTESFILVGAPKSAYTLATATFLDDLTIGSPLLLGVPGMLEVSYTISGTVSSTGAGNAFVQVSDSALGTCPPINFCTLGTQTYSTSVSGVFAATPIPFVFGTTFPFAFEIAAFAGTALPDGNDYLPNPIVGIGSGTNNFYDTVTLTGLTVTDAFGTPVVGATITSESGTQYPVPEPSNLILLGSGLIGASRFRKRRTTD